MVTVPHAHSLLSNKQRRINHKRHQSHTHIMAGDRAEQLQLYTTYSPHYICTQPSHHTTVVHNYLIMLQLYTTFSSYYSCTQHSHHTTAVHNLPTTLQQLYTTFPSNYSCTQPSHHTTAVHNLPNTLQLYTTFQ